MSNHAINFNSIQSNSDDSTQPLLFPPHPQEFLAKLYSGNFVPRLTYTQQEIFGEAPSDLCLFDHWLDYHLVKNGYYYGYDSSRLFSMERVEKMFLRENRHYFTVFVGSKDMEYLDGMSFDETFVTYYVEHIAKQASNSLFQLIHFGSFREVGAQTEPEVSVSLTFRISFGHVPSRHETPWEFVQTWG